MHKPQKECVATTSANNFSWHGLWFSQDVGKSVSRRSQFRTGRPVHAGLGLIVILWYLSVVLEGLTGHGGPSIW